MNLVGPVSRMLLATSLAMLTVRSDSVAQDGGANASGIASPGSLASETPPQSSQKAAGEHLEFEVASIRETGPKYPYYNGNVDLDPSDYFRYKGGPVIATGPLVSYIIFAYKIADSSQYSLITAQLPKWAQTKRFHLEARAPDTPTKDQIRLMVQAMLADRFKLETHTEMREGLVYALTLRQGKPGPHLKQHQGVSLCAEAPVISSTDNKTTVPEPSCGPRFWKTADGLIHMRIMDFRMEEVAGQLALTGSTQGGLDHLPISDRTGLTGKWDLDLEFQRENKGPVPNPDAESLPTEPDFVQALSSQANLALGKGSGRVQAYVIDHVDPLSEN